MISLVQSASSAPCVGPKPSRVMRKNVMNNWERESQVAIWATYLIAGVVIG